MPVCPVVERYPSIPAIEGGKLSGLILGIAPKTLCLLCHQGLALADTALCPRFESRDYRAFFVAFLALLALDREDFGLL